VKLIGSSERPVLWLNRCSRLSAWFNKRILWSLLWHQMIKSTTLKALSSANLCFKMTKKTIKAKTIQSLYHWRTHCGRIQSWHPLATSCAKLSTRERKPAPKWTAKKRIWKLESLILKLIDWASGSLSSWSVLQCVSWPWMDSKANGTSTSSDLCSCFPPLSRFHSGLTLIWLKCSIVTGFTMTKICQGQSLVIVRSQKNSEESSTCSLIRQGH